MLMITFVSLPLATGFGRILTMLTTLDYATTEGISISSQVNLV